VEISVLNIFLILLSSIFAFIILLLAKQSIKKKQAVENEDYGLMLLSPYEVDNQKPLIDLYNTNGCLSDFKETAVCISYLDDMEIIDQDIKIIKIEKSYDIPGFCINAVSIPENEERTFNMSNILSASCDGHRIDLIQHLILLYRESEINLCSVTIS
jgi:hypothetical protein